MTPAEQREAALALANQVRQGRSILLNRLANMPPGSSCLYAADLIENPPDLLQSIEVSGLLLKVSWMGAVALRKTLHAARVRPSIRLRNLTVPQRAALVAALRMRAVTRSDALDRAFEAA